MNIEAQYLAVGDQFTLGRTVHTVIDVIRHETTVELTTTRRVAGRGHVATSCFVPFARTYAVKV